MISMYIPILFRQIGTAFAEVQSAWICPFFLNFRLLSGVQPAWISDFFTNPRVLLGFKIVLDYAGVFFVLYMLGYSTFLFISVMMGSIRLYNDHYRRKLHNHLPDNIRIPVSIIVPAYNEQTTCVDSIKSLLALEYPSYEIVIVDDGSKDETSKRLIEAFHMKPIHMPVQRRLKCAPRKGMWLSLEHGVRIVLISKENGGKADALNMGINAASYPYFICMDSDSVLQYNSLTNIVKPVIEDNRVVAVGGCIRPCNGLTFENARIKTCRLPHNILAAMQVLEYDRSFLASRILFDQMDSSMIISGAFGLFHKERVIQAGGYDAGCMGEDMELVLKLHEYCLASKIDYKIRYAPDAVCWSQVPEKLKDLRTQRRRWHIGLYESMKEHAGLLRERDFGFSGFVSYMYFLLYELLSPYIEIFGVITMILAWLFDLIDIPFMLTFMVIYAGYGALLSVTAFAARMYTIDMKTGWLDIFKAVTLCLFEVTFLRFVLAWTRGAALIGYRKKPKTWGSIERVQINLNNDQPGSDPVIHLQGSKTAGKNVSDFENSLKEMEHEVDDTLMMNESVS